MINNFTKHILVSSIICIFIFVLQTFFKSNIILYIFIFTILFFYLNKSITSKFLQKEANRKDNEMQIILENIMSIYVDLEVKQYANENYSKSAMELKTRLDKLYNKLIGGYPNYQNKLYDVFRNTHKFRTGMETVFEEMHDSLLNEDQEKD